MSSIGSAEPALLRERGLRARERGLSSYAGHWSCARRHRAVWAAYALSGLLMAHVGAFHTGETEIWVRYPYFLFLSGVAALISSSASDAIAARAPSRSAVFRAFALLVIVTVLLTPMVWVAAGLLLDGSWRVARIVELLPQVLPVAALFAPVQIGLEQRAKPQPEPRSSADGRGPDLLQRLPPKLRVAELYAVQAEDHYLRFHTSRGSALILMTLTNALDELAAFSGAQTHRSWWVARDAVENSARGRGRAVLTLKGGLEAPVSRTFSPRLRAEGWY